MFSNRPPAPPGPGPSYKFTVLETCDRIKEEFNYLQQQNHSLHIEREKLVSERTDMQRICVMYYEMANGLNLEMHRQMEIAKRLSAILTQVVPFLSQEHQTQVLSAIERAKQVTMQELNSVLAAQIEDAKSSKFFNGSNSNLVAEQLEAYKMSALSGTPPSSLQTGLHGLNMSHGGSGPSYSAATNPSNSLPGVLPSISPPSNPAMSAALLNGLMSAAGANPLGPSGFMVPTTGATSLNFGRESEKNSADDKQRAAAVAAANSLLLGARPSGLGSSILPPSNPLSGILGGNLSDFPGFPSSLPLMPGSADAGDVGLNMGHSASSNAFQQPSRSASTGSGGAGSGGRQSSGTGSLHTAAQNVLGALHSSSFTSSVSSTCNLAPEEKRRKSDDSRENGNWFGNDEFRSNADKSLSSRRSAGAQQTTSSPQLKSESSSSYPTTSSAPAVGSGGSGGGRSSQVSEFSAGTRWRGSSKSSSGPGAYSFVVLPGGQLRPCALASAPGAATASGLPKRLQHLASLPHGDVVCAVTIGACPVGRASSFATSSDSCRALSNATTSDAESLAGSPSSNAIPAVAAHFAYTGARGSVKLWDLSAISATNLSGMSTRDIAPLMNFDCLCPDSYVRSIKLFPDASHLIIGGESNALTLWDLNGPGRRKAELTFEAPACYALALSPNGKLCYSCCSDGYVSVWDVHNQSVVHQFHGHTDGTSCVELCPDGNRLWTGGLDHKVCCWDIRAPTSRSLAFMEFKSQVFSLGLTTNYGSPHGHGFAGRRQTASVSPRSGDGDSASSTGLMRDSSSPQSVSGGGGVGSRGGSGVGSWLAVGLESSEVEVVAIGPDGFAVSSSNSAAGSRDESSPALSPMSYSQPPTPQPQHFRLTHHESCVLALRFAHHGDWFLTTGKDHQVNAWRTPYGACLLETKEAASVLTCDISPDDKFVVTGSGDKRANLYEVIFASSSSNNSS
ncbi:Transducin-like enhancer protein 1 [Clonorchis sinensis]|uniref:Transducin-like enhancer protein 1 n=3 Tax=Opisthorchiidae TaxID=6196 RepID=A0A8T1MCT4_CLOSI|nr:Transducin-like enhancer protein 1 [Clonorchis sinensis]